MADEAILVRGKLSPSGVERLRWLLTTLVGLFADVEVRGQENLPAQGSLILALNHLSHFDAPVLFGALGARRLTIFAAHTYRRRPFFRWILESFDVIWVDRGRTSPSVMRAALEALRNGHTLGMAPEGTRSPTHALQAGKTGVAFLASRSGAPIIPIAITNTHDVGRAVRSLGLRRARVTLTFGKPFTLPRPPAGQQAEALEAYTDEIMCRIAAMLPPEYRGVYADHPRLKELL